MVGPSSIGSDNNQSLPIPKIEEGNSVSVACHRSGCREQKHVVGDESIPYESAARPEYNGMKR
jgi:hypothetical protein